MIYENKEQLKGYIFSKIETREAGCWEWTGGKDKDGYGPIKLYFNYRYILRAHRLSWIAFNETPIGDLQVLHTCDNPSCVNPEHLFLGTHKINHKDKADKNRAPIELDNKRCFLTYEQVLRIRKLYSTGLYTQTQLAKMYNCGQPRISTIVLKKGRTKAPLNP